MKQYTLGEMEDKYIGSKGTPERDAYEYELKMELLGRMIKATRKERNMTQEELGRVVGVNKSQISKLENHANSATIETIIKVFRKHYEPVASEEQSDHLFTTTEMLNAISEFSHSDFCGLYQVLIDEGYSYKPSVIDNELKFVWLVKQATKSENDCE